MCCPYRRRPDLSASAAHARFGAFIARMVGGSGDAMAGLENIPIAPLATTLGFIKDAPGAPSQATLDAALAVAYRKADEMLAEAQDTPEVLLRDEIAAVNIYTQEAPVYRSLNAALRTNERSAMELKWSETSWNGRTYAQLEQPCRMGCRCRRVPHLRHTMCLE